MNKMTLGFFLIFSCSFVAIAENFPMKPGVTYNRIGNTTFGSDGTSYNRIGNTTFGSDGSSSTTIGNTTFGSDGTSCTRIGNSTFCN
jgi:hypothetical protein